MSHKVFNLAILIIVLGFMGCNKNSGKSGKSIYYNIGGEPTTLNPLASSDGYSTAVQNYIFEGGTLSSYNNNIEGFKMTGAINGQTYRADFYDGNDLQSGFLGSFILPPSKNGVFQALAPNLRNRTTSLRISRSS